MVLEHASGGRRGSGHVNYKSAALDEAILHWSRRIADHGLRLFIGSTAERVLERMPCDVLVVKSNATV